MSSPYFHQDWDTVVLKKPNKLSDSQKKEKEQKKAAYNKALQYDSEDIVKPKETKLETRNFIKKVRCQRNLSQEQLGRLINVQQRIIASWENGKEPIPGNMIASLNKALNINIKKGIIN